MVKMSEARTPETYVKLTPHFPVLQTVRKITKLWEAPKGLSAWNHQTLAGPRDAEEATAPGVLDEHNYFLNKTTVRELQEAVAQMGATYDYLITEVKSLQKIANDRDGEISKLNSKRLLRATGLVQTPPKPLHIPLFRCQFFLNNPRGLQAFTGFTNRKKFIIFTVTLRRFYVATRAMKDMRLRHSELPPIEDQVFLVLSRFKLGSNDKELLSVFNVTAGVMDRLWGFWVVFLHIHLRRMRVWPKTAPRRIIIDSTKKPVECRGYHSKDVSYKTAKIILGMTFEGLICFVSDPYFGDVSEVEITDYCGILRKLASGDEIVADNAFLIENFIADGVKLTKPRTVRNDRVRFEEISAIRNVAERVIQSVKGYGILKMTYSRFTTAQLFKICCQLVNFNRDSFLKRKLVFE